MSGQEDVNDRRERGEILDGIEESPDAHASRARALAWGQHQDAWAALVEDDQAIGLIKAHTDNAQRGIVLNLVCGRHAFGGKVHLYVSRFSLSATPLPDDPEWTERIGITYTDASGVHPIEASDDPKHLTGTCTACAYSIDWAPETVLRRCLIQIVSRPRPWRLDTRARTRVL